MKTTNGVMECWSPGVLGNAFVAQIFNLLYRRFSICRASQSMGTLKQCSVIRITPTFHHSITPSLQRVSPC